MPEKIDAKPKVPKSGELDAGTSKAYKTGNWRVFKPEIDKSKCIKCGLCWKSCPDNAIKFINGEIFIDYNYCKGCRICENECPVKAISSKKE